MTFRSSNDTFKPVMDALDLLKRYDGSDADFEDNRDDRHGRTSREDDVTDNAAEPARTERVPSWPDSTGSPEE
ncbi:hypothetical protein AB0C28_31300 [Nonomuraea sp. NPDC048892]|uniref:hypothetical protein n=1 Tax=Nonomuraea sp. NPDC048892 TaxID=3154624 RepID=UPI0033F0E569